jgi:hypothetical protein
MEGNRIACAVHDRIHTPFPENGFFIDLTQQTSHRNAPTVKSAVALCIRAPAAPITPAPAAILHTFDSTTSMRIRMPTSPNAAARLRMIQLPSRRLERRAPS